VPTSHDEVLFKGVLSLEPLIRRLSETGAGFLGPVIPESLAKALEEAPELLRPIEDPKVLERHKGLLRRLMSMVFPPLDWEALPFAAIVPFSMEPFLVSPRFRRLFLQEDYRIHGRLTLDEETFNRGRLIRVYLLILEKFYGISQDLDYPVIRITTDPQTGLDLYFRFTLDLRFVDVHAVRTPKELSPEARAEVLEHLTDPELLRTIIPPEDFELHGITILRAVDVTDSEIVSAIERSLIDQESIVSREGFLRVQERLKVFFRRPDLFAGLSAVQGDQVLLLNSGCEVSRSSIFSDSCRVPAGEFDGTVFERAYRGGSVVVVSDVTEDPSPWHVREDLVNLGIRSLIIAPLHYRGRCIGTLQVGCPEPRQLGALDGLRIAQLQPIFSMALKRVMDDLENRVQGIIKQECTAIHPTVEWRFRRAALESLEKAQPGLPPKMGPIVFKEVYPFYGISDIRGSATERIRAIQGDLEQQLGLALQVIRSAHGARPLPILQELAGRIEGRLAQLRTGMRTGDELTIAAFIREEVEPVFPDLKDFSPEVRERVADYESAVDAASGRVYRLRRDYEESVSILSERLSSYLDREEAELQTLFPHYFEKHRTDGVDYVVYAGESIMEYGGFNNLYLENLRLWQLQVACGMAWHTEALRSCLRVPLDTAHLVLMQDTPLSIRFRFDEKRFDVDGAYDVRHEIIKSRLDKALVKGTAERLTQPGKIAIVYAHAGEAGELRRHGAFLASEGYLSPGVEKLELEDLPGVQGLRALRMTINLSSEALAKRAGKSLSAI
jgi:hypothetical protein